MTPFSWIQKVHARLLGTYLSGNYDSNMLLCEPFRVKNNLSLCDINGRDQERIM